MTTARKWLKMAAKRHVKQPGNDINTITQPFLHLEIKQGGMYKISYQKAAICHHTTATANERKWVNFE